MIKLDFWYGDTLENITGADCFFNGYTARYSGNVYKNGVPVGDYIADDSADVEQVFPGIFN